MILLTGGTGFLGAHLAFSLALKGEKIRCMYRRPEGLEYVRQLFQWYSDDWEVLIDSIEWVKVDIRDYYALDALCKDIDKIYHAAGKVSFDPRDRNELFNINVKGTANLVNAALENGVQKFCYVSSIAALGNAEGNDFITEKIDWIGSEQHSNYSKSKFAAEREVWRGIEEGLNAVIVNPSVIIGPWTRESGNTRLNKYLCEGMPYYTSGSTGYVDVRDVCTAMIKLMESDISNERFILSSENLEYKQVFNLASEISGNKPPSKCLNTFMLESIWRLSWLWAKISASEPLLSRETARTARTAYQYRNDKIIKAVNMEFMPVKESLAHICEFYRKK